MEKPLKLFFQDDYLTKVSICLAWKEKIKSQCSPKYRYGGWGQSFYKHWGSTVLTSETCALLHWPCAEYVAFGIFQFILTWDTMYCYIELHWIGDNIWYLSIKVTLWDCCVMPNDAWPPLGVFGVLPNLQNVHSVHVRGALLWKITEFFLHSMIWPLEIIYNQFQNRNWGIHGTQK